MSIQTISGKVVSHDKNGRKLGYPTANIEAPDDAPSGIFAGNVKLRGTHYPAMVFIGEPITLDKTIRRAEAHILDFPDIDLYGEDVEFTLLKHIRDNRRFKDLQELTEAIRHDEEVIRSFFREK